MSKINEEIDFVKVNVGEFKDAVKKRFKRFEFNPEKNPLIPILGLGKSGIGKTESMHELAKELGIGYVELRLVNLSEVDLAGIPVITDRKKMIVDWAKNGMLPIEERDGKRGILVLDEITTASPPVRGAALQLLDSSRGVGSYKLPEEWLVIGLGNGISDGGVFQGFEHAVANRMQSFRVEPDTQDWVHWAFNNDVHPTIIAFVKAFPDLLHKLNPNETGRAFPSPRSWTHLSSDLTTDEILSNNKMLDYKTVELLASSYIGPEYGVRFAAFYKYNEDVVSIEDIFEGRASAYTDIKDSQVKYLTMQQLAKSIKDEIIKGKNHGKNINFGSQLEEVYDVNTLRRLGNACSWLVELGKKRLDYAVETFKELGVTMPEFTSIVTLDGFDKYSPEFTDFAIKNLVVYMNKQ